jgi:large subunit ribosomal protein L13
MFVNAFGVAMSTTFSRRSEEQSVWFEIDATDQVLGRLATSIAHVLMGKDKPNYSPHEDHGDYIVVVNCGDVRLTGRKWSDKIYYFQRTNRPSGLKSFTAEALKERDARRLLYLAVKRMLPKNKLGRRMLGKLKLYPGSEHPHEAQQCKPWAERHRNVI